MARIKIADSATVAWTIATIGRVPCLREESLLRFPWRGSFVSSKL
jgi:hypothetical protein